MFKTFVLGAIVLCIFGVLFKRVLKAVQKWGTGKVFAEQIVFNCVWEDPHIDKECLNLTEKDVVFTITSAGCNVLSLLLEEPKQIYSIDLNPCQNALLELKISAILELEYETFWKMFGTGKLENFTTLWYPRLRQHLSPRARQFWDKRSYYFDGNGRLGRSSYYYYGQAGVLAWLVVKGYFKIIPGLTSAIQDAINAETLEQQREIYYSRVQKKLWHPALMWLLSSKMALAVLNGVPSAQQRLLEEESGSATVVEFIKDNLEVVFTTLKLSDNYFYRVYLEDGQYNKNCCPDYLLEENFSKLKDLVDRITLSTETIESFLTNHKEENGAPKKDITRYILLDHMDWMADNTKILESEWVQLLEHANEEECRFLWRSASMEAQFVKDINVEYRGEKTTVGGLLKFKKELADELHKRDRVHTYTSFHIGDL